MSGSMSNHQTSRSVSELQDSWKSRVQLSPEVREARRGLELHNQRVRTLMEDLDMAELWQNELEKRLKTEEEKLQPPLLKFHHQMGQTGSVERAVLEDCVKEGDWSSLVTVLRSKVDRLEVMDRPELVRLTKTVLAVRDCWSEGDPDQQEEIVTATNQMARQLMHQLGQNNIQWEDMEDSEAATMRQLVKEVDGIPGYVARIVDQLLIDVEKKGVHEASLHTQKDDHAGVEDVQEDRV